MTAKNPILICLRDQQYMMRLNTMEGAFRTRTIMSQLRTICPLESLTSIPMQQFLSSLIYLSILFFYRHPRTIAYTYTHSATNTWDKPKINMNAAQFIKVALQKVYRKRVYPNIYQAHWPPLKINPITPNTIFNLGLILPFLVKGSKEHRQQSPITILVPKFIHSQLSKWKEVGVHCEFPYKVYSPKIGINTWVTRMLQCPTYTINSLSVSLINNKYNINSIQLIITAHIPITNFSTQ